MLKSAAYQLANLSSGDSTSTLNCQGKSEPFTEFQIKTSPKGMEVRFEHLTTVEKKGLLSAKVMISKLMAI